jgi:rRNA maturation endonuclease Nob1
MQFTLFAGVLEGAIADAVIGAGVGLVIAIVNLLKPAKPCPECAKPLPKPWLKPTKECPHCGCKVNAKGEKP